MLTLDATATARIAAPVRGVAWLAELYFDSGTIYVTTAPVTVSSGGNDYLGLGSLVDVSAVSESENTAADKITLGMSLVDPAMLGATLGNVEGYRGRAVRLYLQLFDEAFQPSGAAVHRFSGYMDRVRVKRERSAPTGGGSTGRIEIECSRAGMPRARNAVGLRLSDAQQQAAYPGDRGLEYIQTLIESPSLWLSKRFQQ